MSNLFDDEFREDAKNTAALLIICVVGVFLGLLVHQSVCNWLKFIRMFWE